MTVVAGRYRLVRELGRGDMGRAWEAAVDRSAHAATCAAAAGAYVRPSGTGGA
ncbi:hypothetical protein [Actinomadura sp. WMMB 499]|uniref:hypothetical protein n=1 Tax=Actinomadura sp. WMMB 499 TaxID=1219491 RepID=UPI00159DEAE3|nr:hypothetical protein [Actinomadura sp. WMMB 499]